MGLIFPIYLYRKLKRSSCQKPLDRLQYNFAEMLLWWFFTKIIQASWIYQKHGRQGSGLIFPIYFYRNLENSCQKPRNRFHYNLAKCFHDNPLPRLFKLSWFIKQEDHDGPISLTWANRFAYLLLKFQPSLLLYDFCINFIAPTSHTPPHPWPCCFNASWQFERNFKRESPKEHFCQVILMVQRFKVFFI